MSSGRFSLIDNISNVGAWTLNGPIRTGGSRYSSSGSKGGKIHKGGVHSWGGTISGFGHTPPKMPNDSFSFAGYTYPDTGVEGGNGTKFTGTAIVNQVSVIWNFTQNLIIAWRINFQGHLALSHSTAAPVLDTSVPSTATPCGLNPSYDFSSAKNIPNVTGIELTITASTSTEANSGTVVSGTCWQKINKGDIDWTCTITQDDYKRGADGYPDPGDILELKLPVTSTESWALVYADFLGYNTLTADRDTNQPISRQMSFTMTENDGTNRGRILRPGDTDAAPWWGTAV